MMTGQATIVTEEEAPASRRKTASHRRRHVAASAAYRRGGGAAHDGKWRCAPRREKKTAALIGESGGGRVCRWRMATTAWQKRHRGIGIGGVR